METELALTDITLLLSILKMAGNWANQDSRFWNKIEAKNIGETFFQENRAFIPKDGDGGTRQQITSVARAVQEIDREQRYLQQGLNANTGQAMVGEETEYLQPEHTDI